MIDRDGWGTRLPVSTIANGAVGVAGESTWRVVHVAATAFAESSGWTHRRPIVWKPGEPDHNSIDRGLCGWNSYWFGPLNAAQLYVPDAVAFDWVEALRTMWRFVLDETDGWDIRPVLGRYWHGFGSDLYQETVPVVRSVVGV